MDRHIQSLTRRVRADPDDLELARGYRASLLRLARSSPAEGDLLPFRIFSVRKRNTFEQLAPAADSRKTPPQ